MKRKSANPSTPGQISPGGESAGGQLLMDKQVQEIAPMLMMYTVAGSASTSYRILMSPS
jgi:hypothetical protein